MSRKVLIIGAGGQLAYDLIRVLGDSYRVIRATHSDFDICDRPATRRFIKKYRPDVVINTAAFHNTTECELDPTKSFQVNAIGAYNVAAAAADLGAPVVFISTDYVFDGSKKKFSEEDDPNPLNVYGASKLAGENLTRIANQRFFIIRTSGLFGLHQSGKGHNFISLMLDKFRSNQSPRVVNDEFSSITYSYDLATKIKELLDKKVPYGIYHLVNKGGASWYTFAKKTAQLSNNTTGPIPISAREWPSTIRRPKYGCLVSQNLAKVGIGPLRPWQEAVSAYLDELSRE